ncbi:hypothetical protein LCGC14_0632930 [marine sediment metagenome]|uniref:Laminin G domain-containing protein n=1 Tax=marine sediment metagenome TaxID=412755 RepID=A0A0F9RKZ1_9ZZZZ
MTKNTEEKIQFSTERGRHAHKKIFLVFTLMIFSVFLIGNVSAFEFDNGLRYENEDLKVIIENGYFFGIGEWFGFNEDLGSAELKSHSSVDQVLQFGYGQEEVVIYYDFDFLEIYENGLGEVYFTDERTGKEIQKNYSFVYWANETYEENIYEEQCSILGNGTKDCNQIFVRTENTIREVWKPYNSRDIQKGKIRIGLKTYVNEGDYIDAVWTIAGKKVERHAVWTANLNVGLVGFWKNNETFGNLKDFSVAGKDMFPVGSPLYNLDGIIGGAIGFDSNDDKFHSVNTSPLWAFETTSDFTINFWKNLSDSSTAFIFSSQDIGSNPKTFVSMDADDSFLFSIDEGGGQNFNLASVGTIGDGNHHMITIVRNDSGTDLWLYIDGVLDNTGAGTPRNASFVDLEFGDDEATFVDGNLDEFSMHNRSLSQTEVTQLYNGGSGITWTDVFIPTVTLNSPTDNFNTSNATIIFNGTISDITPLNVTLFIDNVGNETNTTGILDDYIFTKILSEGTHIWNYESCSSDGCANGTERTFTVDQSAPTLNITFPTEIINFHKLNTNLSVNWTVSDLTLNTCILEYEGVNRTVTCLDNQTQINITNSINKTIIFYVNDTFGNVNSSSRTWEYLAFENQVFFNTSTFETASETFTTNITTNGTAPTSASLIYNGTEFTGSTITSLGGNDYNISRTIDIPLINGNNTLFHFNFSIASTEVTTSDNSQEVNLTTFEFCEIGQQPAYINFTFTNETVAEEAITAEIDTTWNFWLGGGSVIDSLTFSNTTENSNYQFCLTSGDNRTLTANVSLSYNNVLSQQRSFTQTYSLTNTTTTQNLFLLPTTEGIFVTFQVVDPAEQVISGVSANVTKDGTLISSGITDDAGLITYFLDPDTSYVFSFSKTGLTTVTTTLVPTQTSFTIIMGTVTTISQFDTTRGINYIINPIDLTLINDTLVNFNLTFNSSFHSLEQFGFVLKNSTGTVFNVTTSTTGTGGFLSQILDTGNNTDIIMEVFWTITGNQTNVTRIWLVFSLENEGFSILTFFNDLTTFTNSDLFGLTDFGLGIIVFLIILITTGVTSFKFGITSPPGISVIVFSLVAFFDVALGIIPNPINAIPNFPTIFVGLIFLGVLYSEAIR